MSIKLFVGGLPWAMDNQRLKEVFAEFGAVEDARVILDRDTGRSRGFGFVTYADEEGATKGLALDGQEVDGRQIRVDRAQEKERPARGRPRGDAGGGNRPPAGDSGGRGPGGPGRGPGGGGGGEGRRDFGREDWGGGGGGGGDRDRGRGKGKAGRGRRRGGRGGRGGGQSPDTSPGRVEEFDEWD